MPTPTSSADDLRGMEDAATMLKSASARLTISAYSARRDEWIDADRRQYRRYPISLQLEYKTVDQQGQERCGAGVTLNLSSGGVLFTSTDILSPFAPIAIALEWPFLLQGVCRLRLLLRGRVVRSFGHKMAVRVETYKFRTARASKNVES